MGPDKTCDFRSGRVILQRPIERVQMHKLLANGRTDLLQFVSARTRRGFSAYLVRQPDGKIGFEFETRDAKGKGARAPRAGTALRVLGMHPKDKRPVELHAGRYGPYVKHGSINATVTDRERVDALTLDEALTLLAGKAAREGKGAASSARGTARSAVAAKPLTGRRSTAKTPSDPAAASARSAKGVRKTAAKTPRTATKGKATAKAATRRK